MIVTVEALVCARIECPSPLEARETQELINRLARAGGVIILVVVVDDVVEVWSSRAFTDALINTFSVAPRS